MGDEKERRNILVLVIVCLVVLGFGLLFGRLNPPHLPQSLAGGQRKAPRPGRRAPGSYTFFERRMTLLDLKRIREQPEEVSRRLQRKGAGGVEEVLALDARRRSILQDLEALRRQRNEVSEAVGRAKKAGRDAEEAIASMREVNQQIKQLQQQVTDVEGELRDALALMPNLPHDDVPDGGEEANREVGRWGEPRAFTFAPKAHWELGDALGIFDFERAGKVSGARFVFLRGVGALLERALINFMLDLHTRRHGYTELFPPFLVNAESAFGTGNLPKFAGDMFQTQEGYFLVPTAEVPVTNFHRDEILAEADLPIRYCAFSTNFRSEAGSAGRDTRGLIRQHQFNKVELVHFTRPQKSYAALDRLIKDAQAVLEELELPYRTVQLAAGDMTFSSAMTYDLEVYTPSSGGYREISSCSNFEDFQARRAQIRFRREDEKVEFVHTLNGSGVAVGRTVAALLENHQNEDGSVTLPKALWPYMHGLTRIGAPSK